MGVLHTTKTIFPLFFLLLLLAVNGCVDQDFDEPPLPGLPDISANTTIRELKDMHAAGQPDTLIGANIIIRGIVVADDESGNFQNMIIIQDETGGIEVRMNSVGLYNTFPIGREVYVLCEGLYLGDVDGVYRLNGSPGNPIEEVLIEDHLIGGPRDQQVDPDLVTLDGLGSDDISTLVRLEGLQFVESDTGVVFADVPNQKSLNRVLENCEGNTIFLQTNSSADFANDITPGQRGSITAIYSVFNGQSLLFIRDLMDIEFEEDRCQSSGGGNEPELMSIAALRDSFANGMTTGPANRKIKGVVISDKENGNTDPRNIVLQEGNRGIVVRFQSEHDFALGEEVEVNVSGQELNEIQGLLLLNRVRNERAVSMGTGTLPTPRVATIDEVKANGEDWESTLVKVEEATISSFGSWGGNIPVEDGSGSIMVVTRNEASFADSLLPEGTVDLVAILSQSTDYQLVLRSLSDVTTMEDPGGGQEPLTELNENFYSQTPDEEIVLEGWTNLSVKGDRKWEAKNFDNNTYAQITAYNDPSPATESWLITPPLLLNEPKVLNFLSAQAFFEHEGLTVWVSKDFNGENFNLATWTQLPATVANDSDGQNTWVNSGNIDLSEFDGVVYIGFRYVGTSGAETTTYRIDDVVVKKQ